MNVSWRRYLGAMLLCSLGGYSSLAQTPSHSVDDGVYTEQQAMRGQVTYSARCSNCHGNTLQGRNGPPLAGDDFISRWDTEPLLELANKIRRTMPKDDSPRLTPQEAADVLAYILQTSRFPTGSAELVMDDALLGQVRFPAPVIAEEKTPDGATGPALPPAGTVAQVMRGILFPSSNIVFTVQSIDPGVKKAPSELGTGGFDWLTWGGNIYPGWDVVDYAAISLAESAKLMLTPGRRCENGKPVPVSDPDWVRFTMELAQAGEAAYKASQTRNQEAVSESTNQLNDSCMHCHRVFRGRTHCVKR